MKVHQRPILRLALASIPSVEPVSVSEARLHCRVDDTADDKLVANLIAAARRMAENYTRRVFITQSWTMYLDRWPCENYVELPKAPLAGVSSIVTYNDADSPTTFASSNYYVDVISKPGRVVLRSGASWPTYERVANGILITFVAGYDAQPSNIPQDIRHAILMIVAHLYENRGDVVSEIPPIAASMLDAHRDYIL